MSHGSAPDSPLSTSFTAKIDELEGLRGLLSLWVVLSHVQSIAGLKLSPSIAPYVDGGNAVTVFIVLSGFVIASLRQKKAEPYGIFIARRWLRIFPTYSICVVAAIVLANFGIMPKRYVDGNFAWLAGVHAALMQGASPVFIHPWASNSFLNPTWSISLEWQFYLIAPLMVALMTRTTKYFLVSAIVVVGLAKGFTLLNPVTGGMTSAFLLPNLSYFWLGIASFELYRAAGDHPSQMGMGSLVLALAAVLFASIVTPSIHFGIAIWAAVLAVVLQVRSSSGRNWGQPFRKFLSLRAVMFLGSVSYPLYLCHEPIVWAVRAIVNGSIPGISNVAMAAAVGAIAVPTSIVIAVVLHHLVEKPFIEVGRSLGSKPAPSWLIVHHPAR